MDDCVGSAARRSYSETVQQYDFAEPHLNTHDRSYLLLHREGHRLQWRNVTNGVQSRHPDGDIRQPCPHDHYALKVNLETATKGTHDGKADAITGETIDGTETRL